MKKSKEEFKNEIENDFKSNNIAAVWGGLKKVTGYECAKSTISVSDIDGYVNELNLFYGRFDVHDFSSEHSSIRNESLQERGPTICFEKRAVIKEFRKVNVKKSNGPDEIVNYVLKMCSEQLADIFTHIFNASFSQHTIPNIWKTSKIVPVPKKSKITQLNDLRPVALTLVVFKCFEKLVLRELLSQVGHKVDPFQFAYNEKSNVEDAVLVFLNNVL